VKQGAAWRISDRASLSLALQTLVENPQKQLEMGNKGLALCATSKGATQQTLTLIAQHLR